MSYRGMAAVLLAGVLAGCVAPPRKTRSDLWAGISATAPMWEAGDETQGFEMSLVNVGTNWARPEIEAAEIVVNGVPLRDSWRIFGSGPRPENGRWDILLPGESINKTADIGSWFQTPGLYKVYWRGAGYKSREIEVRVVYHMGVSERPVFRNTEIWDKLESIMVGRMDVGGRRVSAVARDFAEWSKRQDPDGQGVAFVSEVTGDPVRIGGSLVFERLSLADLLKAYTRAAGLQYMVEGDRVIIVE